MADMFPNPEKIARDAQNAAGDLLPNDLPNPKSLIPEKPEIPDFKSLIPKLPIPSFRKPQKIKVEKPPLPKKLQKAARIPSKIPKIPKVPKLPDVEGAVANSLASTRNSIGNVTSAAGNLTNNLPNI